MTLICPKCGSARFAIIDSVECGPSTHVDEQTIQRAYCGDCDTPFLCLYSERWSYGPGKDQAHHLSWTTERRHWRSMARHFETPARSVSPIQKIKGATKALSIYSKPGPGTPIRYSADHRSTGESKPDLPDDLKPLSEQDGIWKKILHVFRVLSLIL